jgi:chaperonin GroEL
MLVKTIIDNSTARASLAKGLKRVADSVGSTLGPCGRNVILEKYARPYITKDGVTVAKNIALVNRFEDMGAQLTIEIATRTNEIAGDGTTTATVLANAIMESGMKVVDDINAWDLRQGMEIAVKAVVDYLKGLSREVTTTEQITQVGTISANGDEEIGKLISDAMIKVGKRGIITYEPSTTFHSTIEEVKGYQFARGFISPYFVTNVERMVCEMNDVLILITEKRISSPLQLKPFMEHANHHGQNLLIIVDELEGEAQQWLITNRNRGCRICVVQAPSIGNLRTEIMNDIAVFTGGHPVLTSDKLETVRVENLGFAKKVIVGRSNTIIVEGEGSIEAVNDLCSDLETLESNTKDASEKKHLKDRIASLSEGSAILKIGGVTETAIGERLDRVEDAINATRAAVEEGIVAGGGIALLRAKTRAFDKVKGENPQQDMGIEIIRSALDAPIRQIARNRGVDADEIINKILDSTNINFGWDAQKNIFADMFAAGIYDPTKVVRSALQDAASIVQLMLTTASVITDRVVETTVDGKTVLSPLATI